MQSIRKGPYTVVVPEIVQPSSPVVVLLGWAGATDRPLSKFSDLLAEHGLISLRCVQPLSYIFAPTEWFRRRWAMALLATLEKLGLSPPRPIIIYAFSNGGAFVVEQLHRLAEANPRYAHLRQRVAGFVFDSAPAYMHPNGASLVLETTMPPGLVRLAAQGALRALNFIQPLHGRRQQEFWDVMLRAGWGKPQLFLYSQDDRLCDAAKLAELIEEKRRRGQQVSEHRWEHSEHVGHYKAHREDYLAHLLPFLRTCQTDSTNTGQGGHDSESKGGAAPQLMSKL